MVFIVGFKQTTQEFSLAASHYTNEHCTMRKFWEVHIFNRLHLKTGHLKYKFEHPGINTNSKTICLLIQLLSLSVSGSLLKCFLIVCLNCGAYYHLWFESPTREHIYQYSTRLYLRHAAVDLLG